MHSIIFQTPDFTVEADCILIQGYPPIDRLPSDLRQHAMQLQLLYNNCDSMTVVEGVPHFHMGNYLLKTAYDSDWGGFYVEVELGTEVKKPHARFASAANAVGYIRWQRM